MKKNIQIWLSVILLGSSFVNPFIAIAQDTEPSHEEIIENDGKVIQELQEKDRPTEATLIDSSESIETEAITEELMESSSSENSDSLTESEVSQTEQISENNYVVQSDEDQLLRGLLVNPASPEVEKYLNNQERYEELLEVIKENTDYSEGTAMPSFRSFFNERAGKSQGVAKYLGISKTKLLNELKRHEHDNYYLGTPFRGLWIPQKMCMSPLGAPNEYGPGFNCTGFVATAFQKAGGNLGNITRVANAWGGEANAYNWRDALRANTKYYSFTTIQQLLNSGKAEKGDIIYFEPNYNQPGYDSHIGFFWGDRPNQNKMWHSYSKNEITNIKTAKQYTQVYLFKLEDNSLSITKSKNVNYEAEVVTKNDGVRNLPYGMDGSKALSMTSKYYGQPLQVIKEVTMSNGKVWFQVKKNGSILGYIDKHAFKRYETITARTKVNYKATVTTKKDGVRTQPYGTKNSNLICLSREYLGKELDVVEEVKVSDGSTWYKVKLNGKELGYIDKVAFKKYAVIKSRKNVNYKAKVITKNDGVRTEPYGTADSVYLTMTSKYYGQAMDVFEEVEVSNGTTWYRVKQKNKELGYIDKNALEHYNTIIEKKSINFEGRVVTKNDGLRTLPYGMLGSKFIAMTSKYYGQDIYAKEEVKMASGDVWYKVEQNGKVLGYIDRVALEPFYTITDHKKINYKAEVISKNDGVRSAPYGTKGSKYIEMTSEYYAKGVDVIEEVKISSGPTWCKVILPNKKEAYIDKKALRPYNTIIEKKSIKFGGRVVTKNDGLRTLPYGMFGSKFIAMTSKYYGQDIYAKEEVKMASGDVWYKVEQNDKVLGYIDRVALEPFYTITDHKKINYKAEVISKNDGVRSAPYGTEGSKYIEMTSEYYGKSLDVIEEVKVSSGPTWCKVILPNKKEAYIDKIALEVK